MTLNSYTRYLLLDTETGGRSAERCSPLSLYAEILDENLETLKSIDLKIKPDDGMYHVEAEGLAVNRISLIEHNKIAMPGLQAAYELRNFITGVRVMTGQRMESDRKLVLLGHNVHYDIRVVSTHLLPEFSSYVSYRTLDTATIVRFLQDLKKIPEEVGSLGALIRHFEIAINPEERHTAKGDARATLELYKKLRNLV